jgi:hypothetical protein
LSVPSVQVVLIANSDLSITQALSIEFMCLIDFVQDMLAESMGMSCYGVIVQVV